MKCGIDIISVKRIARLLERRGEDNLTGIWTEKEISDCRNKNGSLKTTSLAARFAAKEAVTKAFGTGFLREGIYLNDIEIQKNASGEPFIVLYASSKDFFEKSGFKEISVSLSHDVDNAIAMCVITVKDE